MKQEPGIFENPDPQAEAAADARAIADIEAGRVISHKAMREWLLGWGSGKRLPMPNIGD